VHRRSKPEFALHLAPGLLLEDPTMRTSGVIRRWGLVALLATLALTVAGTAMAQRGAVHGGGFAGGAAHFGGGAAHFGGGYGRGYYGRGFYGRGFYGRGCCGWGPGWWWGTGLYLSVLPWYYETLWWGGIPYYYTGDGYYVWDGGAGEYQQINPPAGLAQSAGAAGAAAMNAEVFAYPKAGQSEEQQARDRNECRSWAVQQSASEGAPGEAAPNAATPPSSVAPPGATSAAKGSAAAGAEARGAMAQHQEYLRAETACLEGRNYSVR
jgi:hypothetical protein